MNERDLDIGIVIVSYNTRALLDCCLISLRNELDRARLSHAVWVVDNASSDGSVEMVAEGHPWVKLHASGQNLGFAAGNNTVLRRWAKAPASAPRYTMVLNPDTELKSGALSALVTTLDARPDIGLAGPRLEYPDGTFQHSAFRFPGLVQTGLDLFPVPRLMDSPVNGRYSRAAYESGQPFDIDFPLGACMFVRTSTMSAVGIMDDGFFMYCEEIDWSRRFHDHGDRVVCVPTSVVVHHAGASTSQFRATMFTTLWQSRLRYFAKHAPTYRRAGAGMLVRLGLAARAVHDQFLARRGIIDEAERRERRAAYAAVFSRRGVSS